MLRWICRNIMGRPWIHWLTIVVSLLSAFTAHAVSIRIRDRTTSTTVEEPNPSSGQFLRERIVPVSPVVTTTTQNPSNLLLEYYTRTQVNPKKTVIVSSSVPPPSVAGVYTSLVDSYEDEQDGTAPESSYESENLSAETTTLRAIPAALRRNFGRGEEGAASVESITENPVKPARKKSKSKTRRRKIKRPVALAVTEERVEQPDVAVNKGLSAEQDLGAGTPPKEEDGDKILALEINSEDGKYALIQNFFNDTGLVQPGIVSYAPSEDYAQDNEYTLGKLQENEIWLSDGHLLVLKGGELDATKKEKWPPIDNLQRQKKPPLRIPLDSDNPPPFPVFVNKTGPPVFLVEPPPFLPYPPPGFFGNETDFDPSRFPPPGMVPLNPNGTIPFPPPGSRPSLFPGGPPDGVYGGGYGGGYGQGNGTGPPPPPFYPFPPPGNNGSRPPPGPFPFPPPGFNGSGKLPPNFLPPPPGFNPNFTGPPPGFPPGFPPLVLNPADNETDDPSVFLPPPYDFDYYEDNTTLVPPGPFAPGLVVPPPRDFYTVYNRTSSRPPTRTTTTRRPFPPYFPPVVTPVPDSFTTTYVPKKQRPNGKKPKFPMTNPPDDSLEELYPPTTPVPQVVYTTTKKRKQRPKKPFFPQETPGDYGEGKAISSEEIITLPPSRRPPTIIFPEYLPPADTTPQAPHIVTAIYTTTARPIIRITSKPTRTTTTTFSTTTTTTPRTTTTPKNRFVYVQGQLTTLEELEALGQLEEVDPNKPSTPRPPFDSQGYPTRVVDDDTPVIYELVKEQAPTKLNRKPTEAPAKAYYPGTPKYEPTYDPYDGTGKIRNSNVQFTSPAPIRHQQHIPSRRPTPLNPSRPTILFQQQQPTPAAVYPSRASPRPTTATQRNNGGYLNQPIYSSVPIQSIGPTYLTPNNGENEQPPTQITFIPHQQQQNQPNYNNQQQNYYQTSQLGQHHQQQQPQSGFRPSYPPPQKNPTRSKPRVLFPTDVRQPQSFIHQQNGPSLDSSYRNQQQQQQQQQNVQPEKPRNLNNFAPQGYYSPITNYYQPANPAVFNGQSFFPSFFSSLQGTGLNLANNPNGANNNNNYYQNPLSITNFNANPTISSVVRPTSFGIQYNPYATQQQQQQQHQQLAQQRPRQQLQQSQPNYQPNYNNAQLNQYTHPLYDDINVNYR